MAGEHDATINLARQALDHISGSVEDLVTSSATHAAKISSLVERVEKIEAAINGGGRDNPGLETRVALLERAEGDRAKAERKRATQPATQPAPVTSEIAQVETARAVAAKSRWEAVGKWGPWAAGLTALAAQVIQWARSALGGP